MKPRACWRISVTVPAEAEEAVAECLAGFLGQPAVSYTALARPTTVVQVYLERKPEWHAGRRRALTAAIRSVAGVGGRPRLSLTRLRAENWAESWKRHFRPLEIRGRLLVKPGWSRRRPGPGEAVVVLDPGLSFGTGHHPTTAFCLGQLVRVRRLACGQSFLDIGSGSGILAIAAAKLGYRPVRAFDNDPEAVRVAVANARRNRVADKLGFRRLDLARLPGRGRGRYSVVCANLIANLLLRERRRIVAQVAPAGLLVLAGILAVEFGAVQRAYEGAGLRLVASRTQKEWRSGAFVRV
jgi:ribosomal protein L11 methyltransferase